MSKYFDNDSIFFVPREFVQEVRQHPQSFDEFRTGEKWPFYAMRENQATRRAKYAMLIMADPDYAALDWPMRWFAPYLKDCNLKNLALPIERCSIDGNDYILVVRIESLDYRFKGIELKDDI